MQSKWLIPDEASSFGSKAELDRLLTHAFDLGAADITITSACRAYIYIQNELQDVTKRALTAEEVEAIAKIIAGDGALVSLRSADDLDGRYSVPVYKRIQGANIEVERKRFRWNMIAVSNSTREDGVTITMRAVRSKPPRLADLDVEPEIVRGFRSSNGLIFVCGATGEGKTTLLSANLMDIVEDTSMSAKIVTYEDPIEITYDEVDQGRSRIEQTELGTNITTFARAARNAMRRHAQIILIGETRDLPTLEATLALGDSGHLVLTTLHSNDVAQTIARIASWFSPSERMSRIAWLGDALRMIVVQKLLKSEVTGKMVAVREFLIFDQEVRDQMRAAESIRELSIAIKSAVNRKGQSFYMAARRLHHEGRISESQLKLFERSDDDSSEFNMTL